MSQHHSRINYDEQPAQIEITNDTVLKSNDINFQSFLSPNEGDNTNTNTIPTISDIPIIDTILGQNETFKAIINNRIQGLKIIEELWAKGKRKEAIQSTQLCKDLAIINDLITFFLINSNLQNISLKIDHAIELFPFIIKLASSKYDVYIRNAIDSSWILLKLYNDIIINDKNSPSNAKKDSKKEREEKMNQYNSMIRFFQQLRLLPNIVNIIGGVKKIEGVIVDNYANDIDGFIKKCSKA